MIVRIYLRRSKNDEGKQQYSLDVQEAGCRDWLRASPFVSSKPVLYVDDGEASDEFVNRTGLRKLLTEAKPGDVVICRDQSRLGRDAIEVTLVVRDLVRDRGCRLFYYTSGHEVQFANAIDQAVTFIQGTGHQMELEAIRSRVREALRMRARSGRVAGGRCYGYRLERVADGPGRFYTIAIVDEAQAEIVRQIFAWRCESWESWGLARIAHELNNRGIPSPRAGRRGTGSWSPSCIRSMLLNPRYRGLYVHGKIKKVRRAGIVSRVDAETSEVITIDLPEWRIIEADVWARAQEGFRTTSEADKPRAQRLPRPPERRSTRSRGSLAVVSVAARSASPTAGIAAARSSRTSASTTTSAAQPCVRSPSINQWRMWSAHSPRTSISTS